MRRFPYGLHRSPDGLEPSSNRTFCCVGPLRSRFEIHPTFRQGFDALRLGKTLVAREWSWWQVSDTCRGGRSEVSERTPMPTTCRPEKGAQVEEEVDVGGSLFTCLVWNFSGE